MQHVTGDLSTSMFEPVLEDEHVLVLRRILKRTAHPWCRGVGNDRSATSTLTTGCTCRAAGHLPWECPRGRASSDDTDPQPSASP